MSLRTLWSAPALAVVGALALTWPLATSCRTATPKRGVEPNAASPGREADPAPPAPSVVPALPPPPPDAAVLAPAPFIRVGVAVDKTKGSIGAGGGVVVTSLARGETRRTTLARATFVPVTEAAAAPPAGRFMVQVASLVDVEGARSVAEQVRRAAGLEPHVRWSEVTRTNQVRAGAFEGRDEALRLVGRLNQLGIPGSFVVTGEPPSESGGRIRLVETGEVVEGASVLPVDPSESLALDATEYRGYFEIRPGRGASVTLVNVLGLEDYLRGVVPNELSPQAFPEIEALKAQAVAARTYAMRNRGQFASQGYDICATPSCQVYRGRSTEHELSDRAVASTRGMVATYRGAPIHALYTSTCGGHTEDGKAIFDENGPYLKGVVCVPERWGTERISSEAGPGMFQHRGNLGRDVAFLQSLAVLEPGFSEQTAAGVPRDAEVRGWINRLVAAGRRTTCGFPVAAAMARRADFFRSIVGALCWEERGLRLLGPADVEALLQAPDATGFVGEEERRAAALLLHEGALSPFADGTLRPAAAVTRAEAVEVLARVAEILAPPALLEGDVAGVVNGRVTLRMEGEERSVPLDPQLRLFRDLEGARSATRQLSLTIGDAVRLVHDSTGRATFLEARMSRKGAAADRTSRYFRWEVRLTPQQVAGAIARYGSVGRVRDLLPRRIGVSGRVVELAVQGDEGILTLAGMKVRWGLGLRENLFVIDRERNPDGTVARFVFTGKGWGHGVGLCQVGAFGMAHAGSTFVEILRHYYTGIEITELY